MKSEKGCVVASGDSKKLIELSFFRVLYGNTTHDDGSELTDLSDNIYFNSHNYHNSSTNSINRFISRISESNIAFHLSA